jgi:hypothetical protein
MFYDLFTEFFLEKDKLLLLRTKSFDDLIIYGSADLKTIQSTNQHIDKSINFIGVWRSW